MDCPLEPLIKCSAEGKWEMVENSFRNLYLYIYVQNVVISRELRSLKSLTRGIASGPHAMGQAPRTFYRLALVQACSNSSKLYFTGLLITPVLLNNHICRKTSI